MPIDDFSVMDTSLEVQPPKGSAEPAINYGGASSTNEANDPLGVLPKGSKPSSLGPSSKG